jgi:hypothetical protein
LKFSLTAVKKISDRASGSATGLERLPSHRESSMSPCTEALPPWRSSTNPVERLSSHAFGAMSRLERLSEDVAGSRSSLERLSADEEDELDEEP